MVVTITLGARPMPALVRVLVVVDAASIGFWIAVLDGKPLAGVIVRQVAATLRRRHLEPVTSRGRPLPPVSIVASRRSFIVT